MFGLAKGWHLVTGGFQLHKIQESKNYDLRLQADAMDGNISAIFDQKFHYFSKGCQAYVFESEDGKYVLKFFRHHKYRIPFWFDYLTGFSWGEELKKRREHFRQRAFANTMNSYELASTHLREECGTVFAHLQLTDSLNKKITIQGTMGRSWDIDLDHRLFILQKRAENTLSEALLQRKKENDLEGGMKIVHSFFQEVPKMIQKGIIIRDYNCVKNLAVWDHTVHMIDLGSFYWLPNYKDPFVFDTELRHFSKRLVSWCRDNYPDLLPYVGQQMDQSVATYFQETEVKKGIR